MLHARICSITYGVQAQDGTWSITESNVIEPARTAANGKLKANIKMVKNLVHAANEEQRLGLTELREKASAATWHLGNCIVAVRKLEASVTEISLLVAHRQADYRWVLGLQGRLGEGDAV